MIDFNNLIDNHLFRGNYPKKVGRYYPSEIGLCLRKTWYSYKDPKKTDSQLIRVFEAGNLLHKFVEEVIKSEKNPEVQLLDSEMPIKIEEEDFIISGRIDDLILLKVENKKILVEVKSCKFLPKDAKEEHEFQLQLYMHSTKVHDGIILYVQKDNLQTIWFNVHYNKEKAKEILERFKKLHSFLIENILPDAEAKNNPDKIWLCDKCPWKEECWEKENHL